jgi:ABC-2 type transport system ATP-binding protein
LAAHRQEFQVVLVRLFAGKTLIHVLSDRQPGAGFEPATPDLEDLYFATIRGFIEKPALAGQVN